MEVVYMCLDFVVSPGSMRTSPTTPKSVPPPQRQSVAMPRRNPPMTRNGGDSDIMELHQQVLKLGVFKNCLFSDL